MKVELFYSPGCSQCAVVREDLKATAERTVAGIEWRELNVLEDLDYAVELGVLSLPAIAVDGELIFSSLPTPHQLRDALIRRSTTRN
ncbi:thioredoxin family protein [Bradyrhizobium sp.]|uniref:glutaredoxin family protein n=1 Tax=Bradyrhizobium sp. TaxID=376 RepID=UPI0026027545|nr:thioredoxin family protein [Bradyrhizobium sp.]